MKDNGRKRKTIEKSKLVCLQVRDKKTQVIESLAKISEIMEAEISLKSLPGDIRKAIDITRDSNNGFVELQPQLEGKTAYNNKLKEEVDKVEAKFITLKSEVDLLKSKVERQEEKISAVDDLTKKIAQLEAERDSADSRIRLLGPEMESFKNETSTMQSKLAVEEEELQRLKPEKDQLREYIETLSEKIKDLGDLEVKKKELNNLIVENNETVEEINKLKSDFDSHEQLKANVELETNNINEEVEGISKEISSFNERADSLNETVIPKEDVDNLQTQLNTMINERDGLKEKTAEIEKELEKHMKSKGGIIEEVNSAGTELETKISGYNSFKERVELYESDTGQLERLKKRIPELEKSGKEHTRRAETAQEELKHLNNAVDIMKTELMSYKEAMEEISNLLVATSGEPA